MSLDNIYKRLNMSPENGLCIFNDNNWDSQLPRRLVYLIKEKIRPDAFFVFDKKPLVLFYNSPDNREELFKAIWNFNEAPVVIIVEANVIEIFNGFSYLKNESSRKSTLDTLEKDENLENFSYFKLVTGKSLEHYQGKLNQQNRVDFQMLENIRDARNILIQDYNIEGSLANALIGKCIFVRYLIDRKVRLNFDGEYGELSERSNKEFCDLFNNKKRLIEFFKYLKEHFNDKTFLINDNRLHDIPKKVFSVLKDLIEGTKIATGQRSFFDIYDFSIIPVEFISSIYEHFIGKESQANKGAYYTPKFLVDFILSETVEKYFNENPTLHNCIVLDPACGSGIFLVEALRRIIEHNDITPKTKNYKAVLKKITEENIFGIDCDENAVNVAIFSIYLALLDYQEPKDIESFTFPNLQQNGNFHVADFFNTITEYNKLFNGIAFNFIIGNPPWKRGASENDLFLHYIKNRELKEHTSNKNRANIEISNKEIAQAYLLRTSDFSSENTKCALIITSKTLYNLNAKKFRSYFLQNFFIDKVLELSFVAKEVFSSANSPASILFFKYSHGKNTEHNEIIHISLKPSRLFSLFKVFILQKTDIKRVIQRKLMEYDLIWKVLVSGSYLDFNLTLSLNRRRPTINEAIKMNNALKGQGVNVGGKGKRYNMVNFIGSPLIDHNHDILPFFVKPTATWSETLVERERNKQLFKAPVLLIKHGLKDFSSISAILYTDSFYKHSLTGIKSDTLSFLRNICGLFNSQIFSYYIINASSALIDRSRAHDEEKFTFPFIDNPKITILVEEIENISKHIYIETQHLLNPKVAILETKKQELIGQLNKEIFNSFDLDKQELALIDYAINITIPLIMRHDGYERKLFSPIPFRDKLLEEYIKVILYRFATSFRNKHLKTEIWHTENIVGIFFKVISNNSSNKQEINWLKKKDATLLNKIMALGTEKLTEDLFIQKDIRGFEKKGFYIIKPNEIRLWHKSIGYLDANEFMDAILTAGKESYHG